MLPKSHSKDHLVRLVNLQTGRFEERAINDATLCILRQIEARGVIQILDVQREG